MQEDAGLQTDFAQLVPPLLRPSSTVRDIITAWTSTLRQKGLARGQCDGFRTDVGQRRAVDGPDVLAVLAQALLPTNSFPVMVSRGGCVSFPLGGLLAPTRPRRASTTSDTARSLGPRRTMIEMVFGAAIWRGAYKSARARQIRSRGARSCIPQARIYLSQKAGRDILHPSDTPEQALLVSRDAGQ